VPLDDVFAGALGALAPQIAANDAVVTADALPTVPGDRRQLQIVLTNLIGNAIKYHASDEPPQVHVSVDDAGDAYVISVADNGRGVPSERRVAIFEMFERSDGGRTTGHGIGLALCRRIVERHDGRIWVEPGRDRGSVFRVALPKSPAP
jgi:signal transduction histidine kinase